MAIPHLLLCVLHTFVILLQTADLHEWLPAFEISEEQELDDDLWDTVTE